jgi:hypothetical protein
MCLPHLARPSTRSLSFPSYYFFSPSSFVLYFGLVAELFCSAGSIHFFGSLLTPQVFLKGNDVEHIHHSDIHCLATPISFMQSGAKKTRTCETLTMSIVLKSNCYGTKKNRTCETMEKRTDQCVFEIDTAGNLKVMRLLPMLLFQLPSLKNSKSAEIQSSLASSLVHA